MTYKELEEVYADLKEWHDIVKFNLDESKDIIIEYKSGDKIKLDEVQAACFKAGVLSVIQLFEDFTRNCNCCKNRNSSNRYKSTNK